MRISLFTLTVLDYDRAIDFYVNTLGFTLLEDTDLGAAKRWVRVGPPTPPGSHSDAILLARAVTPEQVASVGRQTGGRVFAFLETDNFERDYAAYVSRGVEFVRPPREEPYGTVAVFKDLYGNLWDMIQPRGERWAASDVTLEAFERHTIPLDKWNHRAHLTVAYLLLRQGGLDEATERMRRGVQAYNAAKGVETTATSGYHETLTVAWMRILHATIAAYGPGAGPDDFFGQHSHFLSKVMLRLYYTRPRIMSERARREFVEPDLSPLPVAPAASA